MNKFLLLIGSTAAFMLSCNDTSKETKEEAVIEKLPPAMQQPASNTCYQGTIGKDTTDLSITGSGNAITGNLAYNHFEKDDNTGTINGYMKGDTLVAFYTFQSEGMSSVREVAFLKKGDTFVEGFGEAMEKDGRTVFKDRKALQFDEKQVLRVVACRP